MNNSLEKHKELDKYFTKLTEELLRAYASFKILDTLLTLRAPNKVGKKHAVRNARNSNKFKYLFTQVEASTKFHFIFTLAKFFDIDADTVTLHSLARFIRKNKKEFNSKNFKLYYPDRANLVKNYRPLLNADPKILKNLKKPHTDLIGRLSKFRNHLAHNFLDPCNIKITVKEFNIIFRIIEKYIQYYSNRVRKITIDFDHRKKETEKDVNSLFKFLSEKS